MHGVSFCQASVLTVLRCSLLRSPQECRQVCGAYPRCSESKTDIAMLNSHFLSLPFIGFSHSWLSFRHCTAAVRSICYFNPSFLTFSSSSSNFGGIQSKRYKVSVSPEESIQLKGSITIATASCGAGNSCRQEDVIAATPGSRPEGCVRFVFDGLQGKGLGVDWGGGRVVSAQLC